MPMKPLRTLVTTLLWMLLWAYPVLTWRVQWWIHREAFALWWKGVAIVPYLDPTEAARELDRAVSKLGLVGLLCLLGRNFIQ